MLSDMPYRMKKLVLGLLLLFIAPVILLGQGGEVALADKYYLDGEFENALQLYSKLQRKDVSNRLYNLRIADSYLQLEEYNNAVAFMEKVIRKNPEDHLYPFIQADLLKLTGEFKKSKAMEDHTIAKLMRTEAEFLEIGNWLDQNGKTSLALRTYLQARKTLRDKHAFSNEIADLYYRDGEFALATEEYLSQYERMPATQNITKNNILRMVDDKSADLIEQVLLETVNRRSNDKFLRTIIYEFYVLTENFYEAFIQCKSIDKVFRENGSRVFQYAITMRNNKNYKLSNKALDYIIANHSGSPFYLKSFQEKTVNGELEAFESIPVDTTAIRQAVIAYDELLTRFGRKAQFFSAMYRKANLLAFYLFDLDAALAELQQALSRPIQQRELAKAKLLTGDILLMKKDYAKATLIYDEVAKTFHEGQIGAMAKYKQGRLSYFKGDFEYAQARLKTIKDNTSNDISNDAIKLFLVIQDNIGLDTTTYPLQRFAQAQLRVFQRDFRPALTLLDSIAYAFPNHTLTDEILWEKANIFLQMSQREKALLLLDKILENYPEDIYGDDALYTKARLYDYSIGNKEKAMEYYIEFLTNYSGSLYIVQVRKRIRELRHERM
ncbi:MAG TPA: tetratricopeptide repeat protein [Bacteroidetes bacterium]|nr:tetratricopeptide repeat protein [Bacteroidota bacterium]